MRMYVVFNKSPSVAHKYRVTLPNHRFVDFGSRREYDYTDHQNSSVMRSQLIRRGAIVPEEVRLETDPAEIHREMLHITKSTKEDWEDIYSRNYWERWMLYSYPTINQSKLWMTMKHGFLFMPLPENFFYCGENFHE